MSRRAKFDEEFILDHIKEGPAGCWNWQGSLNVEGRAVYNAEYAYRISYRVFVGEIPAGLQINHHCDNPACVNPEHIYAGTKQDNTDDMWRRKRGKVPTAPCGEAQHLAYPDAVVDEVRERYRKGEMQKDLAAEFGVSLGRLRTWISGGARGRVPIRKDRRPACGTRAGCIWHRRHGERPCDPCREADAQYMRDYKAKRARRAA